MNGLTIESHDRTFQNGVRALAQAKKHKTSADPVAYELWYEYVAGHHRQLSAEVKERCSKGVLTDSDVRELHANHLSSVRVSEKIEEIGADTQAEVDSLLAAISATIGDLAGADDDLSGAIGQLAGQNLSPSALQPLAALVLSTSRRVCQSNVALQRRLTESQSSIATLQLALETSRGEAMTDGLTSLFNRRAFEEHFGTRFREAVEKDLPLTVLMLDIDHFKSFNDTHGHMVGDQVIRLVASCIKERLGLADLPARYGGEEFAVISLGRSVRDAAELAEEIRRKIDGYEIVQQGTKRSIGKVTISIGVAGRHAGDTQSSLLERADARLYAAKHAGRNRVEIDDSPGTACTALS